MADKQGASLTDSDLRKQLKDLGENPGPINDSTRSLWLKKLNSLKDGDKVSVNSSPAGRQTKKRRSFGASPSRRKSKLAMFSSGEEDEKEDEKDVSNTDLHSRDSFKGRYSLNNVKKLNANDTTVDQPDQNDIIRNQAPITIIPGQNEESRPRNRRSLPRVNRIQARQSVGSVQTKLDVVDSPAESVSPKFVDDAVPQFIRPSPRSVSRPSPPKPPTYKKSEFSDTDEDDSYTRKPKGHGPKNKFIPKAITVVRRRVERINDGSNEFLEKPDENFVNNSKQTHFHSNSVSSSAINGSDHDEEFDIDFASSKSKVIDFICQPIVIVLLGSLIALFVVIVMYFGGIAVLPSQGLPAKGIVEMDNQQVQKDGTLFLNYLYQYLAEYQGNLECEGKDREDLKGNVLNKLVKDCFKGSETTDYKPVIEHSLQLALSSYPAQFRILVDGERPKSINMSELTDLRISTTVASKPLYCRVTQAAVLITKNMFYLALFIGISVAIYYMWKQRWMLDDEDTRHMFIFVDRIIETLRRHHEACEHDQELPPYLPIPHVRDMLIPPFDRKKRAKAWSKAVAFLSSTDSRIRVETQTIAGEEYEVWRWIGVLTPKMKMDGAANHLDQEFEKGKFWQGPAFDKLEKVVRLPIITPTPCLKIRYMHGGPVEKAEDWNYHVKDALLEKCNKDGAKILHVYVDTKSPEGCVYVKCDSLDSAGQAFRSIYGNWFDGRLVIVKFVTLTRYHQRFPDALTCKQPLASSGQFQSSLEWMAAAENPVQVSVS